MKYFAYGSNMLTERLTLRVPHARCLGVARALGRRLTFRKRSDDKSGKCDLPTTGNNSDVAYGVLFDVPDSQRSALDDAEGLGHGYKDAPIEVLHADLGPLLATGYFATDDAINSQLVPYDWYHCLVVSGARQHKLPGDYVSSIAAIPSVADPMPKRKTRLEALQALKNAKVEFPPMKIDLTDAYNEVSSAVRRHCALDDLVAQVVRVRTPADLGCVPCEPGVYFIFSRSSEISKWGLRYIGQIGTAVKLRERLKQHLFKPCSSKTHSQRYCITEQADHFGVAYRVVTPVPARLLVEAICIALHSPPDNDKGRKREKA